MRIPNLILNFLFLASLTTSALAAKYQEAEVSGGGAIQGSVLYHGPVKTRTVLPTKDKKVCGRIRKEPLVVVGDGGAVKDSVVFLKNVASGKPWSKVSGGARPVLDQKNCKFDPHVQVARRGKIDIVNSDPVLHNTHGYYGKRTAFNVALPIQDGKVTKILKSPGEVRVDCDAHGWMLAWIYVIDNPYFAQTGEDGTFSITDVPPGEYTLAVWQEELGLTEMPVVVAANGTTEMSVELKGR